MAYRHLLLLICLTLTMLTASADVYRWKDVNGDVIFSDTPQEGAEKIELNETTIVPAQQIPREVKRVSPPSDSEFLGYKSIEIVRPSNEETLRNVQDIAVSVALSPGLQSQLGDLMQLYLDGLAYGEAQASAQFVLHEVARGSHKLAAAVVASDGSELIRSADSTFFLHHTSIQHPPPGNAGAR